MEVNTIINSTIVLALVSSFSKCIGYIDWTQFVIDIIATILGFGLAIWSARIIDRIKARSDAKELKKLMSEELNKILNDLKNFDVTTLDVQPLKIPLWESAINTGQLSLLDFEIRERLFSVYNEIKEFNSWCLIHTNYFFANEKQNQLLVKELNNMKHNLLSQNAYSETPSIRKMINELQ